ncbi:hypothetical protein HanXRQr2_Chr06g0261151 [Helianthus annuus]|uniref:Uncharacterized protein n=1 Tax=Helianthus annuus TaxID=4232 RepID=A0A9K3NK46_HELAN|nr:hypothetical protein HanXRQr2_Chr06g0261151 [Helianthus annuus]
MISTVSVFTAKSMHWSVQLSSSGMLKVRLPSSGCFSKFTHVSCFSAGTPLVGAVS